MIRSFWVVATLLFATSCTEGLRAYYDLPVYRAEVQKRDLAMVAMRDGIRLATDIYIPSTPGPWPVVLIRDPYSAFDITDPINRILCRYGYAVVHQDVRGRLRSQGRWHPVVNEREDGLDTIAWLKTQSFFNGNLALYGPSYLGIVQWAMLDELPPEVKTIIPQVSASDLFNSVYEDGMFRHEFLSFWASAMPTKHMAPLNALTYQSSIREFPNDHNHIHLGGELDWYRQWQTSVSPNAPLWQNPTLQKMQSAVSSTDIPMLMVGGWYDIFLRGQLKDFSTLGSRSKSRIVIGPWTHLMGFMGDGEKPFPRAKYFGMLDHKIINWLDHHLRGEPLDEWGPIYAYQIGEDVWHNYKQWPSTTPTRLYLSGSQAQRCDGGSLMAQPAAFKHQAEFRYDPLDPVPTRGGSQLLSWVMPHYRGAAPSNRDQSGLCERDDVLSFISPAFKNNFRLSGPTEVHLLVRSSAEDTSFTAKLIEVGENQETLNIRDGITSLAWRNGATKMQTYAPGTAVEVKIDLSHIEWTLKKGSRLRIDISSSNFPAFHAHPNRPGLWSTVSKPEVAEQTLLLGQGASYVVLGRRR